MLFLNYEQIILTKNEINFRNISNVSAIKQKKKKKNEEKIVKYYFKICLKYVSI